jgi:subtilisin family serine protease
MADNETPANSVPPAPENGPSKADGAPPDFRARLGRFTVPPFVTDRKLRKVKFGLPDNDTDQGDYIIELNLSYDKGVQQAGIAFREMFRKVLGGDAGQRTPVFISKSYFKCSLSAKELRDLIAEEDAVLIPQKRVIYKVWPDFPVEPLIDHSTSTVKADAAIRAYQASGDGITWAVIDSGIDGRHVHFGPGKDCSGPNTFCNTLYDPSVASLHRDFTAPGGVPQLEDLGGDLQAYQNALAQNVATALKDEYGHGTHVAGIIAGGLADTLPPDKFHVRERVFKSDPNGQGHTVSIEPRPAKAPYMRGVAPQCKLVSLRVLDKNGRGSTSGIMLALRYIREELNDDPKLLRIHGVNLSIGYEFDAEMFACGQSPLCVEVDRLVKTGVVVVVAAGNTGYTQISTMERYTKVGLASTINDPGNAALAITVGSTHRDAPHTYGVSFFSSKGPTGDGRLKPDLVAPGERITSAATPGQLARLGLANPPDDGCTYIDDSGTSMASPHVSGAIAAFLSIRREFIQRPDEVKKIFLDTATPLGDRERYFQGHGLVDLMRAIQSV